MRKKTLAAAVLMALSMSVSAFANPLETPAAQTGIVERDMRVYTNGTLLKFEQPPVIYNDRTMVHIRTFAEALGCDLSWGAYLQTATMKNSERMISVQIDNPVATIVENGVVSTKTMEIAPMLIDGYTYLPLRAVADIFGADIKFDYPSYNIYINYEFPEGMFCDTHTFYYQSQPEFALDSGGSGYCWVCSYAMLLNDVVGNVTPVDVSRVNYDKCGNGAYCYHTDIVKNFGAKFVPALDASAPYFGRYEAWCGGTYLNNPEQDDLVAIAAIKEALDNHPNGVLVRFEQNPHTIVAIGYIGDTIFYNDPGNAAWQSVTFNNTYPFSCGLTISDLTYIQAIEGE